MARWVAMASLVALAGCRTVHGAYDPRAFGGWPADPGERVDGCAVVVTSPGEDAARWRRRAAGLAGAATALEVPLGAVSRAAALRVFGELFRDGAAPATPEAEPGGCRVVVAPRPTGFSFRTHGRGPATFEVSAWVEARTADGARLLARAYDSGQWRAGAPGDAAAVAAGTHVALQAIMLRAAADVRAALDGAARSAARE